MPSFLDYLSFISPTALGANALKRGYGKPVLGTAGTIAGGLLAGPVGATIGGTAGTALGGISDNYFAPPGDNGSGIPNKQTGNFFSGYNSYNEQLPRFTPEQQNALSMLLQQGAQNANFGGIENRAREQFANNTIPGLAERFTALGSGGSQRSSAFQGALGSAASDLESQLGALRGQYGMQQLGLGLQPSFENIYVPRQGGLAEGSAQGIGQLIGKLPELFEAYTKYNQLGGGK